MRLSFILIASLTLLPASAQYQYDLATTRDGSILYFTYAAPGAASSQIYRWSQDSGLTLFGDRPDLVQLPPHFGQHLYGTETTYTGAVLYHAEPLCFTGMGPGFNDCTIGQTQIVIPGQDPFNAEGFLLLSPNGRYGVSAPFGNGAIWTDYFTGAQIDVDLHKYAMISDVIPPFIVNQHAIANNGSFLITPPGPGLQVWSKSGVTMLPITTTASFPAISADGTTVAVSFRDVSAPDDLSGGTPTYVFNLASGQRTRFPGPVSLSDDGQTVAYLSTSLFSPNSQALVAHSDGTGARQITNQPEGIRSALLSGDAHYVYVVISHVGFTTSLQRYDLATGAVVDVPAVPY